MLKGTVECTPLLDSFPYIGAVSHLLIRFPSQNSSLGTIPLRTGQLNWNQGASRTNLAANQLFIPWYTRPLIIFIQCNPLLGRNEKLGYYVRAYRKYRYLTVQRLKVNLFLFKLTLFCHLSPLPLLSHFLLKFFIMENQQKSHSLYILYKNKSCQSIMDV